MTTDAMPPQSVVDALAAMRKPCPEQPGATEKSRHWSKCIGGCRGAGTVPAHPWLWEKCTKPCHFYLPDCGLCRENGDCDGSGTRVRRAETVTMPEWFAMARESGWQVYLDSSPRGCEVIVYLDDKRLSLVVGNAGEEQESLLRVLYAAEQAERKAGLP